MSDFELLGSISASIAGDHRYTDRLEILINTEEKLVRVTVSGTVASGGIDGPGGANAPNEHARSEHPLSDVAGIARAVSAHLKSSRFNFHQYGKPTKRFYWSSSLDGAVAPGWSGAKLREAIKGFTA
jgi:hypothetical protein